MTAKWEMPNMSEIARTGQFTQHEVNDEGVTITVNVLPNGRSTPHYEGLFGAAVDYGPDGGVRIWKILHTYRKPEIESLTTLVTYAVSWEGGYIDKRYDFIEVKELLFHYPNIRPLVPSWGLVSVDIFEWTAHFGRPMTSHEVPHG